jgi:hypothetical protein
MEEKPFTTLAVDMRCIGQPVKVFVVEHELYHGSEPLNNFIQFVEIKLVALFSANHVRNIRGGE